MMIGKVCSGQFSTETVLQKRERAVELATPALFNGERDTPVPQ